MELHNLPLVRKTQQCRDIVRLLEVWFPKALAGDHRAVDKVIRLWERESKLLGIDAPTRIEMSDGLAAMSPDELLEEARKRGIPVYEESAD
jgi:hypothetical protein